MYLGDSPVKTFGQEDLAGGWPGWLCPLLSLLKPGVSADVCTEGLHLGTV